MSKILGPLTTFITGYGSREAVISAGVDDIVEDGSDIAQMKTDLQLITNDLNNFVMTGSLASSTAEDMKPAIKYEAKERLSHDNPVVRDLERQIQDLELKLESAKAHSQDQYDFLD